MTKPHFPTRTDTRLTSPFGWRRHPVTGKQAHHDGIDLAPRIAGTTGVPIYAVVAGVVKNREWNNISGNRIYIEHTGDTHTSVYLHLASMSVKVGQKVKRGQQIGIMGATGQVTGVHLHFGISIRYPVSWGANGSFIDPEPYLEGGLTVDGRWGRKTTTALQNALGTVADGEIWGQFKGNQATQAVTGGIKFGKGGSPVIKALQRKVGAKQDGIMGKETISKLQQYLGTPVDGVISNPSTMVKELQRQLNAGTF